MDPNDLGTPAPTLPADPGDTSPADTPEVAPGQPEPAVAPAAPVASESFINPADLPEEIKPHWKRMHRAYTKALDGIKTGKADIELLGRFRSDPAFARELVQIEASRLGLHLAPANGTTPAAPAAPTTRVDTDAVARIAEAMKSQVDPSLHWMIPGMAAGQWAAAQEANRPLVEKERAKEQSSRETEWGTLSERLTETAPGWEAHQDDMNALIDWLRSPSLTHPQFGDKLTFLYNSVTNGSAAKVAAIRDMGAAARNASRTGQTTRAAVPNIADRVRKATTTSEALRIAAEEAERELRAAGIAVPD